MSSLPQRGEPDVSAVIGFVVIGFVWLLVLGGFIYAIGGVALAAVWLLCAFLHWLIVAERIGSGRTRGAPAGNPG